MNSINFIKNYFTKRNTAIKYKKYVSAIIELISKINSMGNARIIKPSEFQINEMVQLCTKLKTSLINDSEILNVVTADEKRILSNLAITNLSECKTIASVSFNVTLRLQKEKTPNGFLPLVCGMNLKEILFLTTLFVALIYLFKFFHVLS